jgi:hypothetical protein
MVCIVVRVVVRDRTEGAGEEKVLSPPRRPVTVRVVVASEDSPYDGATVDTVGAIERPPMVGGGCSSLDILTEPARSSDAALPNRRLGTVVIE